ncbi:MAG: ABC transporter permease [Ktedonobacterales bacterium]
MSTLVDNLPALIILLVIVGFLVFTGSRLGPSFVIRRLAGLVFVLLGVTFITFILGYFAPGNIVTSQLGQHPNVAAASSLRHFYGLDLPWWGQYLRYLNLLLHFNLGYSWVDESKSVWQILSLYLPASMQLGVMGTILSLLLGVPLGVMAAVRSGTRFDSTAQSVGLVFYALPFFVIIPFYDIAMVTLVNHQIPSLATSGWGTWDTELAPIVILAIGSFAYYLRLTRSSMVEVLRQDYVRTARAKGISERLVIFRHAFRNALIPLLTAIGPALAYVVTGLFIIESLMNIPGIGEEGLIAITSHDFPVVEGTVMLLALAVVFMNLVTDVAYGFADPRVKSGN